MSPAAELYFDRHWEPKDQNHQNQQAFLHFARENSAILTALVCTDTQLPTPQKPKTPRMNIGRLRTA